MNKQVWNISLDRMGEVADAVLVQHPQIVTLSGSLGAGKTTLVQHILKILGITAPVQSPTYAYLTTYTTPSGLNIFHFDLYRLRNLEDFLAAGFDEYLYQPHSLCLVEWPECIESLLAQRVCRLALEYEGTEKRRIDSVCDDACE